MKGVSDFVNNHRPFTLVAYKASTDVIAKAVTLLVTVGAARALSPEAFGVLALAMTTGWILGVASDAGLPLYLARAVATGPATVSVLVREVMSLRAMFAIAAMGAGAVIAALAAPPQYSLAFGLVVLAHLTGAALDTLLHVYRGLGRSEVESTVTIVTRLVTAVLVVMVLVMRPSLLFLSVALLAAPGVALVVTYAMARRLITREVEGGAKAPPPRMSMDVDTPRPTLTFERFRREAAPIGVGVLLSAIYFRCDVYFISYWHGLETVGMYNAVFRLVEALRLLPAAALAVAFPHLCRAVDSRPLARLALTLTAAGLLMMAGTLVAAPAVVGLVYGAPYLPAAPALGVLALALPFFFLNYALTHQVIAWDGQRAYAAIAAGALVANLASNILLIPSQGMVGAAWSTVLTELVVMTGCFMTLQRKPLSAVA